MCTPYTESQKMVAMATSPMCKVSAICAFCRPTTQTPSITNCLVAIVHTKPVIAILVPKLVAMATFLRASIAVCLHWIACPRNPTPRIKQRVASCHTTEVIAHRKPKSGCHGKLATSLSCRVSALSAFCRPTTQTPLHNQSPSRYRSHKASYSNFSPKIGCHGNIP